MTAICFIINIRIKNVRCIYRPNLADYNMLLCFVRSKYNTTLELFNPIPQPFYWLPKLHNSHIKHDLLLILAPARLRIIKIANILSYYYQKSCYKIL